jgi:hypothetical protein
LILGFLLAAFTAGVNEFFSTFLDLVPIVLWQAWIVIDHAAFSKIKRSGGIGRLV